MKNVRVEIDKRLEKFNFDEDQIELLIKENERALNDKVNDVLNNPNLKTIKGQFTYCGYDPMNMKKNKNKVFHKTFIGIMDNGKQEFKMGPVVVETNGINYERFTKVYYIDKSIDQI